MKKDCGFWDINKNYIEDIQEITMEEEMELLRQENADLKKYIERMNEPVVDMDIALDYAELKAENDKLKKQLEFDSRYNDMQAELDYGEKLIEKYKSYLQEIKAIVCGNYEIIDPQGRKDILKLITKAEEE